MDPGKISENKPVNYGPQQNIRKQAGSLWTPAKYQKTKLANYGPQKMSENKLANYGPRQNIRKQAG